MAWHNFFNKGQWMNVPFVGATALNLSVNPIKFGSDGLTHILSIAGLSNSGSNQAKLLAVVANLYLAKTTIDSLIHGDEDTPPQILALDLSIHLTNLGLLIYNKLSTTLSTSEEEASFTAKCQ